MLWGSCKGIGFIIDNLYEKSSLPSAMFLLLNYLELIGLGCLEYTALVTRPKILPQEKPAVPLHFWFVAGLLGCLTAWIQLASALEPNKLRNLHQRIKTWLFRKGWPSREPMHSPNKLSNCLSKYSRTWIYWIYIYNQHYVHPSSEGLKFILEA